MSGTATGEVYPFYHDGSLGAATTITYSIRINSLDFSPDGRYLAVGGRWNDGGNYGKIYPFGSDGSLGVGITIPFPTFIEKLEFSPDGNFLAMKGWSPTEGYLVKVYPFNFSTGSLGPAIPISVNSLFQC